MVIGGGHEITPVAGSARQLDGTPADLTRPSHYPVEGLCLECGQPIRCERFYLSEWRHIAPAPAAGKAGGAAPDNRVTGAARPLGGFPAKSVTRVVAYQRKLPGR
jgi:hypothetical protein